MRLWRWGLAVTSPILAACGGGGSPSSPSGPAPTPTPAPGHPVTVVVFYDENASGGLDAGESVRIPGARVTIGGQSATADGAGRAVVSGVPAGAQSASLVESSLPPYYAAGAARSVQVPPGGELMLPVTLSIGRNRANVYMGFGDSITAGDGSRDGSGYRNWLRAELERHLGRADVILDGIPGTRSDQGSERLGGSLTLHRPAYTLIVYGTNDWNLLECKEAPPCFTIDALRSMIGQARSVESLPIVATIPPVNPAFVDRRAAERNDWVRRVNELVRPMVRDERAVLADVYAAMLREPRLESLFADHVHPNDEGYRVIGRELFRAITDPAGRAAAAARFGPSGPGS